MWTTQSARYKSMDLIDSAMLMSAIFRTATYFAQEARKSSKRSWTVTRLYNPSAEKFVGFVMPDPILAYICHCRCVLANVLILL